MQSALLQEQLSRRIKHQDMDSAVAQALLVNFIAPLCSHDLVQGIDHRKHFGIFIGPAQ
jgi:hypothetical protein